MDQTLKNASRLSESSHFRRYVHLVQRYLYLKIMLRILKSLQWISNSSFHVRQTHVPTAARGDDVEVLVPSLLYLLDSRKDSLTMAPPSAAKAEREKKVQDILSIASSPSVTQKLPLTHPQPSHPKSPTSSQPAQSTHRSAPNSARASTASHSPPPHHACKNLTPAARNSGTSPRASAASLKPTSTN